MKTKELIEKLKCYDPDSDIKVIVKSCGARYDLESVFYKSGIKGTPDSEGTSLILINDLELDETEDL